MACALYGQWNELRRRDWEGKERRGEEGEDGEGEGRDEERRSIWQAALEAAGVPPLQPCQFSVSSVDSEHTGKRETESKRRKES